MASRRYPSDLTDEEWYLLEPHLPASKKRGRPRLHSPREILDAVFYVLKSGCQWRMLPRDFPPWKTVFHYFRRWRIDGIWERMNRVLRRRLREKLGREPEPSAGIVDSQSAETTGVGGEQRGFDGGKKVRGRKRHILVDTEGLVVEARVHSAKVPDQVGIRRLLEPAKNRLPRLRASVNRSWSSLMSSLPAVSNPAFSDEPPYDYDHVREGHPEIDHPSLTFRTPHQLLVGVVPGIGPLYYPPHPGFEWSGVAFLRDLRQ